MIKLIKIIFISTVLMSFTSITFGEEVKKDCSEIKNLYKKIVCKTNKATSEFREKKTLADFIKEKK